MTAAFDQEWIASARSRPIEDELARRGINLRKEGKELVGPCPRCGTGFDRFAVNPVKQLWNCRICQRGGDVLDLVQFLDGSDFKGACTTLAGEPPAPAKPIANGNGKDHAAEPQKVCVASFDYTDESGAPAFSVDRFHYQNADGSFVLKDLKPKKVFSQKRLDPKRPGAWIFNVEGAPVVPYRLPELLEAIGNGHQVLIVEGEAKVDLLKSWNVPATCCAGGAKKWRAEHSEFLRGADVVILPDNDQAGRDHADVVGASLQGIARAVRVLELPGLEPKGDVLDWAAGGGTVEALNMFIRLGAQPWVTAPAEPSSPQSDNAPPSNEPKPAREKPAPDIDIEKRYVFLGDAPHSPPREIINGLLPAEGIGVTGGQSTAGKTFEEIHKAICLASGAAYFGRKIIERVGTVFVAAEGRPLMPNRFAAALMKSSIDARLPITWPKLLPDFSCPEGIKQFIADLKAIDERYRSDFGVRLGHVTIDTVAATFGMKDEDDNAEATKICNVLRSIGDELGVLMAPVHHYGKNAESGLRGASAWKGSADVILGVLADIDLLTGKTSNRELVCAKARDGEQGPISPFDLEFMPLGLKDDGEIYGSCCVVPKEGEKSHFDKEASPSKSQRAIVAAIDEAIDSRGGAITPRAGMPQIRAAKVSDIRTEFDRLYVVDGTDALKIDKSKAKAFKRAIDHLPLTKFGAGSAEGFDWIWRIT